MSACYIVSKIDAAIVMFYKLQYTSIHLNHNKFVFYNTCFTIYCTIKNLISQCFDQENVLCTNKKLQLVTNQR